MTLEAILDRLGARRVGKSWMAQCPCHEDSTASLAIDEKDGLILFYDHGGQCTTENICAAIGITTRDLHIDDKPRAEITYDYTDEAGELLFQMVRYEPKTFKQRHPDGKGGWIWNLNGVRRVLYHLVEILPAENVLLVEGEKDCERLREFGMVATTSPHGAGKWRDEYVEFLESKNITIIPDNDAPGRKHAEQVAASLHGKAKSVAIANLPEKIKDVSDYLALFSVDSLRELIQTAPPWTPEKAELELFHTPEECENVPEGKFSIEDFLQDEGVTFIAGLSGHSKTWLILAIVKALFAGGKLWTLFRVNEMATRIVYLIPEVGLASFMSRVRRMGLLSYIKDRRLLVRTLSKGPAPDLDDPRLLAAIKGAHVILDTAARFGNGDENSASDNARGLAADIFGLIATGARSVICAHHSPKGFLKETTMSLEGILRGTGDIGAMATTVWGVKQLDEPQNIVYLECVKARNFQHCQPFQLRGRPCIDETRDFLLYRAPGESGKLSEEQPNTANESKSQQKDGRVGMVRSWWQADPNMSAPEMLERFATLGIDLKLDTVFRYRKEARKNG